ncbi:lipocalin family protein [uncultured Psychroserpens sp.]|uniref:lipocalin family protein n=1 Tax=uncultured Psychroserpens sp. TaxID=255436 RepID=UPI00262C4D2E|nr:lipocalin family protein [uncultured Psychroserpens sp.]
MKTFIKLSVSITLLFAFGCSNNDDGNSNDGGEQSTLELLVSGRWYQESKTPGSFSTCEKSSYIEFSNETDIALHFYNDDSGPCESEGVVNANYNLSGNTLEINVPDGTVTANIVSISEDELIVTAEDETVVFDKTEG